MRCIIVKWVGATNTKSTRLRVSSSHQKAKYYNRNATTPEQAVREYATGLGWPGRWARGELDGTSDVFVRIMGQDTITVKG